MSQIYVTNNGQTMTIDLQEILSTGLIEPTPQFSFTKHIGGQNPRKHTVTVTVDFAVEHDNPQPSLIEFMKNNS